MNKFNFLREYIPTEETEFYKNIFIECYSNGSRVIFFQFDGIPYKEMTVPENVPIKSVLDILNEFVFEIYNETTVDIIESHLEIFFRNF